MRVTRVRRRGGLFLFGTILLCVAAWLLPGCESGEETLPEGEMTLSLSSTAFEEGEAVPTRFTCDGEDISPPLAWGEAPAGARAFVLIVDDPDAPLGVFTHWVLFNIPADRRALPEAVPAEEEVLGGAMQGKNGLGRIGYTGPCPPPGSPHHYRFNLYALDQPLAMAAGASRTQVLDAMQEHVLAQGRLTGTYQR